MSLRKICSDGRLKLAKLNFGRENRKSVCVNYYAGCTYIHIKNSNGTKCMSLGIDEYEEMTELLMDSLKELDERFKEEDAELNNDEDIAASQTNVTDEDLETTQLSCFKDEYAQEAGPSNSTKKRRVVVISSSSDDEDDGIGASKKSIGKGKGVSVKKSKV